jgi:hypothetical protein
MTLRVQLSSSTVYVYYVAGNQFSDSLAHGIIDENTTTEFQVSMLLCILTPVCHLSIILVAGRACILASCFPAPMPSNIMDRGPTLSEYQAHLHSFSPVLKLSQFIQGIGQALFGPAFLYTLWLIFKEKIYPVIVIVFVVILQVVV